jgi:hypothetical protein
MESVSNKMQHNEPKELDNLKKGMLCVAERSLAFFAKVKNMATLHFTSSFNYCGFGCTQIVLQRGPGGKAPPKRYASSKKQIITYRQKLA